MLSCPSGRGRSNATRRDALLINLNAVSFRITRNTTAIPSKLPADIVLHGHGTIVHYEGMRTVFEAVGGNDGLHRLAAAWHRRVMADDVVSHAFSHGFHPRDVERLAAYWAEALGGPSRYSESYGDKTTVVRMHSGNGEQDEMNRRAIACFDQAMADVGLADDCTTTSLGRPRQRCPATTSPRPSSVNFARRLRARCRR